MKAAIIENGTVVNVAKVADQDFADSQGWIVSDTAKIGDIWDGTNFAKPGPYYGLSPEKAKEKKRSEVISDFIIQVDTIKGDTPDAEIDSWYRQELEARNYRANKNDTPMLDAISNARGKPKSEIVASVEALAQSYSQAVGAAIGSKQARIEALESVDLSAPDALKQIELI